MKFHNGEKVLWYDRKRWLGLPWTFTRYYLVEKEGQWVKIMRHKGLLTARIDDTNLYRCYDLTLHETLIDKICGTGTIEILSNDAAAPRFNLRHIKNPYKVRAMLSDKIELERKRNNVAIAEFQTPKD